ncbi:MerR family transcriptional regulator [Paenibacillus sp. J23TS9]|uniref:MerR family transcriptional regulator n=1 Tax=Paenibacillus sp. J23TS9 TaxID=2807193 RepID=UPI001B081643|nr:MerR family DNA-binding transcriptional regulator [Paenibacillus sp. J23TS9]GIP26853.1 MerR family transcriptional regulator [Paenibacillus sp. J23TS9]
MERCYKPSEIARELNISTSALRHYESWGVIPVPDRAPNGYRLYTHVHLAYFRCLRAMFPGFGVEVTCDVLRSIQLADIDTAFWLVNRLQAELHQEKKAADQTLELLQNLEVPSLPHQKLKRRMTIGEAAAFAGVTASAIRHWEKEDLLHSERDPENGYRLFSTSDLRKILLIRTLRSTIYFLKSMKGIVQALDHQNIEQAKKLTEDAISTIHERIRQQLLGVHQLIELCNELELM